MAENTDIYNQIGIGLAKQGKYDEAIEYFKKSLLISPDAKIFYLLGLAFQRKEDLDKAAYYFQKSFDLDGSLTQPLNGLGLINFAKGDYQKASKYYKRAISINPLCTPAYNNLGNAYKKMNKVKEAIKSYLTAIKIDPTKAEPYCNLGTVYFQENDFDKSLKYLKKAVEVDPKYSLAYYHLGIVLRKLEKFEDARDAFIRHLNLSPNHAEAYGVLGNTYLDQGKYKEAKDNFDKAISLNPNFAQVHNDLGNLYRADSRFLEAIKCYQNALDLDPHLAGAESNLGIAFSNMGKTEIALKHLKKAIKIDPKCVEAYYHLGIVYEKISKFKEACQAFNNTLKIKPDFNDALPALVSSLMQICDWGSYSKYGKKLDELTTKQIKNNQKITEPALLNVARIMDLKQNLAVVSSWSRDFKEKIYASRPDFKFAKDDRLKKSKPSTIGMVLGKRKIRVGYLSCDFYNHATAHLMLGLFGKHNRRKFEIFTYSYGPDDNSFYRKKIMADSDKFVDLADLGNIEAAKRIYADKIDILVDLKGFTKDTRFEIVALKPAPMAVSWLGFPGTTGADFIDYLITDKIITPSIKYYREKLIYLPCYQVNDDKQPISSQKFSRGDFGLPQKGLVLASFNSTYKITGAAFDSWMKILKSVPGSVLWILATNPEAKKNLKKEAQIRGIDAKRIIFADNLPKDKHLARISLADLALDTFIYNGHTTTSDCLWVGVPVVTLLGNHFASRVSASLLTAIGLPELITKSQKEYEKLAIKLAKSPRLLKSLREKLLVNRLTKPLFDTKKFTKDLEKAYLKIWKNYLTGQKPKTTCICEILTAS